MSDKERAEARLRSAQSARDGAYAEYKRLDRELDAAYLDCGKKTMLEEAHAYIVKEMEKEKARALREDQF